MNKQEIWINRKDYRQTRCVDLPQKALVEGQVLVSIDKFALTSNNVGYAVSGDLVGYWHYFPTHEQDWGIVGVWGLANVVASKHPDIAVGERISGFFPMATDIVLQPTGIKTFQFVDGTEHRQALPPFYNQYQRCQAEPAIMQSLENERCVLFPLYMTGFVIADFLTDNDYFSAEQVIIGSVSSKTGYSLAAFLRSNAYKGNIVGLTSNGNINFVNNLQLCDQVISYDDIETLKQVSSVYIDMAGNSEVLARIHQHLQDNMKSSQIVGVTHWESRGEQQQLPGCKPTFFFTPKHIKKRSDELGATTFMEKAIMSAAGLSQQLKSLINMEFHYGSDSVQQLWQDMLNNKVSGQRGLMLSLQDKPQK